MRIALAQINPTIGDIAGNTRIILDFIARASSQGAAMVVFPEMCVLGYPPKDLLLKPDVVERCVRAAAEIAQRCEGIAAIIGYPMPNPDAVGRPLHNVAALCADGRIAHRHVKHLLPTYDVFDETRYFEPGEPVDLTEFNGVKLGISVCEDLWNDEAMFARRLYHENPIAELAARGAQLFINCSASPFVVGKHKFRMQLLAHTAQLHRLPLLYVNQVGGNDELVFDGNSCAFDTEGNLIAHAKDFEEDLLVVEVPGNPKSEIPSPKVRAGIASVYAALVLGLRDYCRKCGFKKVVLGLSGGIDSAVTACIAAAALGRENVIGIAMPGRYSSQGSLDDAAALAGNLGLTYHVVPITQTHEAMERTMAPLFAGTPAGLAEENVQARLRANILMSYSNKFGAMLITTGNKSELAVGYCTLYGDMCGGLAVISDVPKMMVYKLAEHINAVEMPGAIPRDSITKVPSAELRPNQTDQDSLPPYEVLDAIVERNVEQLQTARQIIAETGYDAETVMRVVKMIDRNEYKREQSAPGLKVTSRAFGFGRRMPIAQRYEA